MRRSMLAGGCGLLGLFALLSGQPAASRGNEADYAAAGRRAAALLKEYEQPEAPGCAVAVYRDQQRLFDGAFGFADLAKRERLTPSHAFGVASMSKQFTAATLAIAADEGLLSLQDDVRKHIPELSDYGQPVTLWQLVHHTAGLRDDGVLIELTGKPSDYRQRSEIIALLARQRNLNFAPGTRFLYGNTGYMLIPEIIERAAGVPFAEYARSRIFAPLGMQRSHYLQQGLDEVGAAIPYSRRDGHWVATETRDQLARIGNGGLVTTLADYHQWAANLLSEGDALRGGPALIRSLKQSTPLPDGSATPYAFGLRTGEFLGWRTLGHGGSGDGFKTHSMLFPELGLTVAGFCNNGVYAQPLVMQLASLFLPPAPSQPSPAAATRATNLVTLAGVYRESELGWPMIVTSEAHGLRVDGDALSYLYSPLGDSHFGAEGGLEIEFVGGPRTRELRQLGERRYGSGRFQRIQTARPTAMELQAFTGRFFSAELGAAYVIAVRDGGLIVRNESAEPSLAATVPLQPLLADEFYSIPQRWVLHFQRGADGSVDGFKLTAQFGWVRDVSFERSSTAALSWAKREAQPLRLEPTQDYSMLSERLRGVSVVALGEANHNAHEFLQLRNQLFRYLVQQQGFTAIAVESDYLQSLAVDDYVLGKPLPVDPQARAVMSWSYGSFQENRELIEWMRDYNATAGTGRKLRFYGLEARGDFSYDGAPILSALGQYLERVDREMAVDFSPRFESWKESFNAAAYRHLSQAERDRISLDLQDLLTRFEQWHVIWTRRTSQLDYQRAYRLAVVARQLETELRTGGGGRDIASFDNLRWALEREGPQGRVFLFMHNMHVTRWRKFAPPANPLYTSIGEHAAELLGDRLFVIGTAHGGGATRHWLDLPGFDNCLHPLSAAAPGSMDALLAKVSSSSYLLDLRRLPADSAAFDGFDVEAPVRNINVASGYSPLRPARSFDALVFFPSITPLQHQPSDLRCP
ncbi:serine hydrolase [Steroidobacter sp.]|uniref:serine hydrolase n=1 Tax=Steroidobacter sp. TaxID=1978227 RepID=UPI001A434C45|nr:serine hydrolase [Steroidobacter sp.]MBL8266063.1 serine hydrolase [Steroidobacter sp.]